MKAAAVRSRVPEELEERASAPDAERSLDSSAMTNAELEPVHLTQREREVLAYVAGGADNLKISAHLQIAERTVKSHVTQLYRKLGAENRTQLALRACHLGVRPPPDL